VLIGQGVEPGLNVAELIQGSYAAARVYDPFTVHAGAWRCVLTLISKRAWLILAFPLVLVAVPGNVGADDKFVPQCTLPWVAIAPKESSEVDKQCPIEGKQSTNPKRAPMQKAKNELCATGAPTLLSYQTFKTLQKRADEKGIPSGGPNSLPEDRADLKDIYKIPNGPRIGEGSVVRYVGYISNPRYSNTKKKGGKGEAVNCNLLEDADNDIHMDLVREPDQDPCLSVTAEIIPHFRPPAWEVNFLDRLKVRPVRVTGHLFYDSVHKPCVGPKRASPPRISLWEIHPVYAIDVCSNKTLGGCAGNDESKWVPLHEWFKGHAGEEEDGG
jgi:hypothetical protein